MKDDRQALRDIRTLQGLKKLEELTENNKDIPVECIIALRDVIYKMECELKTPQEREMDARMKILCVLEPGKDDEMIKKVERELRQLFRESYGEKAVEKWNEHYPID
jgi:type II secretory pathway predicted ATPase ExeA